MSTAVLDRVSFDSLVTDARIGLAKKASSVLGYNRLAQAIAIPGALLFALRGLEIAPFSAASVRDYMVKKEYTGMYSGTKAILRWLAGFAASVSMLGFGLGFNADAHWGGVHIALNTFCLISVVVCLIGTLAYWFDGDWQRGDRVVRSWEYAPISQYRGNIPEFALQNAIRIKEAVPNASLDIVYLKETTERKEKPLPDPFLRVRLNDETYFIDVWDEKEYEIQFC